MDCSQFENILYHGSAEIICLPAIIKPDRPMDYGAGFYCTTSKQQARDRALSKTVGSESAYVNIYRFQPALAELKILRFEKADEKWVDFVERNRREKGFGHDYDIVIGPVADDKVNRSFSLYESGIISKRELISRLKTYKLVDQYLFHTKDALESIVFLRAEKITRRENRTIRQNLPADIKPDL